MKNEKRLIDANGSYTLNANDNTGYSICFCDGIISVFDDFGRCICELDAEDAPTVDAVEVVHGQWKYYHKQNIAVCTNCSFERDLDANFGKAISCPNCGAKMDGDGNG